MARSALLFLVASCMCAAAYAAGTYEVLQDTSEFASLLPTWCAHGHMGSSGSHASDEQYQHRTHDRNASRIQRVVARPTRSCRLLGIMLILLLLLCCSPFLQATRS